MSKKKAKKQGGLNPEQEAVVAHLQGPLRVVATAGSGKTTALIERAAHLIESGVDPNQILLISFSVIARKEMARRINARLPGTDAGDMCRTFHSIALDIFRREVDPEKVWAIDTSGALTRIAIRTALNERGIGASPEASNVVFDFLSRAKNDMLLAPPELRRLGQEESPGLRLLARKSVLQLDNTEEDDLISILYTIEDMRQKGLRLDGGLRRFANFDDLLVHAVNLLHRHDVRGRWSHRWAYVMQDEAQDECAAQAEIAEALCSYHRNYMVVGDVAQSVYAFRGAQPQRMLRFEDDWPGATTLTMMRNYRSGIEIVEASNKLVDHMPPDSVLAVRARSERQTHSFLAAAEFKTQNDEARAIAANVRAHHHDGMEWKDQAILVRTNAQTGPIEAALADAGVPYHLISGDSFFELRETGAFFGAMKMQEKRATPDDVRMALAVVASKQFADRVAARYDEDPERDWLRSVQIELGSPLTNIHPGAHRRILRWIETMTSSKVTPYKFVKALQWTVSDSKTPLATKEAEATGGDNMKDENVRAVGTFVSDYATYAEVCDRVDLIEQARASRSQNRIGISTVHKCVHPDTLVSTDAGVMPIRDIGSSGTIGTVAGPAAYCRPVVYNDRPLLTVTTDGGYEITVTRDHKMMAWTDDGYAEVPAEQLAVGQRLRLSLASGVEPIRLVELPGPPLVNVRAEVYSLPDRMSRELSEFLGLMVADGTIFFRGFRLGKAYRDTRDRFAALVRLLFGCEPKLYEKSGMYVAEVSSVFLAKWSRTLGGLDPHRKAVPECVMRSASGDHAAFLRGLFEDAAINIKRGNVLDHIALSTEYETLAKTAQVLLLRLGYISRRFVALGSIWRVDLYGQQASRFAAEIGFSSPSRTAQACGAKTRETTHYTVPLTKAEAVGLDRSRFRFERSNAMQRGHVTRTVAAKLGLEDVLAFHHDPIVSIRESHGPAMCVEVPGHGRFVQNGFDGCNSKGAEFPVVYIAGCMNGLFPLSSADLVEERRLFYVAVTRAMDEVWVSFSTESDERDMDPSIFLGEAEIPISGWTEPGRRIKPSRVGDQLSLI